MSKMFGKPLGRSPNAGHQPHPITAPPLDSTGQLLAVGDRVTWGYLGEFDVVEVRADGWIVLRGGKVHFDFPGPSIAFKKVDHAVE